MSDKKTIAVHSETYHADDLFAVSALQLLLDEDTTEIVRTRDPEVIKDADYVVDVGGVYDPEQERFDHHQTEGAGFHENGIPYAAFGLVWKKYGEQLSGGKKQAQRVNEKLVQPIDAGDNGYSLYELTEQRVPPYTIQVMFNSFRKKPDEDTTYDDIFFEMLTFAKKILKREIQLAGYYVDAEEQIRQIYKKSKNKEVVIFDPGTDYGRELIGGVLCEYPEPVYAIIHRLDDNAWQVVAIKKEPYTFENRKRLPEEWGGNRSPEELKKLTGFDDVIFVHRGGFMAKAKSKETAIGLAEKALEM